MISALLVPCLFSHWSHSCDDREQIHPQVREELNSGLPLAGADLGGGSGKCAPSPPPRVTCGFLIQLVFCIKICLRRQSVTLFLSSAPPAKKNPGSAPDSATPLSMRNKNAAETKFNSTWLFQVQSHQHFVHYTRYDLQGGIIVPLQYLLLFL